MAGILRGDVRWADLDPTRAHEQSGRRPVLILSQDVFNARSGTVIAVALTSQEPRAGFPLTQSAIELVNWPDRASYISHGCGCTSARIAYGVIE